MNTTTIGLDIAKAVFQVHGIDARGQTTLRKRLRRAQLITFFANQTVPGGDRGLLERPSLGA